MYIKNIFDVKNYKALDDGFEIKFEDTTYIVGDNAKNKTTIGGLPVWISPSRSLSSATLWAVIWGLGMLANIAPECAA